MLIKEPEIAMVNAASSAVEYMTQYPQAETEEIIRFVMKNVNAVGEAKIASIVAADKAIKLRRLNLEMSNKQIIQEITNQVFHILADIRGYSA